jgi:hypothetical protein
LLTTAAQAAAFRQRKASPSRPVTCGAKLLGANSQRETAMTQQQWKVGPVAPATQGFSISVQNAHGKPLLTLVFATQDETEQAEDAMRDAIENAVYVVGHDGD